MAEAGYGGAQQGAADAGGNRATVLAVAGLMLALFLVALDQTIVGTALPQIVADLEGFERYAWVTTAYLLASTAMIPVIGKLGDIYGRKWFILGGIFVFLAGSALCGAAWGMIELIIFRGIQGLGAGMIFANIFTSVADIFPDPARRAKYQGVFFSVFALSSVVGPAMGGWITDNLDWRWVFYVNLPLGLFSLFALPFVLPQSGRRRGARIDFPGAITITASVVALLLALSWVGEGYAWDATRVLWGFAVSAVLLAVFVPLELRAPEPVLPLSLFKGRVFATGSALMFLVGIGMFGIILYVPLFVQGVLGQTATNSGTVLTPLVLSMTVTGMVGGFLISRVKRVKPFMLFGSIVMTLGVYLLTTLGIGSSTLTVAVFLGVTGLGLGLIMPTVTLAVQSTVPVESLGVATSSTQFVRSLGSTVGTAVVGSFVTRGYAEDLAANAPSQAPADLVSALDNPQALVSDEARVALSEAASAFPGGEAMVDEVVDVAREALSGSIHDGFVFILVAVGASILAALAMKNVRLEKQPGVASAGPASRSAAEGAASPSVPVPEPSVVPRLAEAFGMDEARNGRDEALRGLLSSVNGMSEPAERRRASAALLSLAERIERGNGDYPNLLRAAAGLANGHGGTERERAVCASRTVVRTLREKLREGR